MSTGLAIAGQAISGGINQAINSNNSRKEFKRQKELMGLQQEYQKDLWDYTNAENQVEHYKNAGLNVGLMYDKGGSSASTGSFGMSAPSQAPAQFGIDINQAQQTQSVVELNQALADKARAEADNARGGVADNLRIDSEMKEFDLSMKEATSNGIINLINSQAGKMEEDWKTQTATRKVAEGTIDTEIKHARESMLKTINEKILAAAKYDQVRQDIENSIKQLEINKQNADTQKQKMLNDKFIQDAQIKLQESGLELQETKMWVDGVSRVVGMGVNVGTRGLMGGSETDYEEWEDEYGNKGRRAKTKRK